MIYIVSAHLGRSIMEIWHGTADDMKHTLHLSGWLIIEGHLLALFYQNNTCITYLLCLFL